MISEEERFRSDDVIVGSRRHLWRRPSDVECRFINKFSTRRRVNSRNERRTMHYCTSTRMTKQSGHRSENLARRSPKLKLSLSLSRSTDFFELRARQPGRISRSWPVEKKRPPLHHTSYSGGRDSIRDKNGQITDDARLRSSLSLFNAARQKRGARGHSLRAAPQSDPSSCDTGREINPRLDIPNS
jgi:hypothetical protein